MKRIGSRNSSWWNAAVVAYGLLLAMWVGVAVAQEMRTWSDASGKFKIKGTFKGEKDGVVTIEQEDGEEIEVETKKLSPTDQRLIAVLKKEVSDNPFKKKKDEDPFKPKGKSGGSTSKGTKPAGIKPSTKGTDADATGQAGNSRVVTIRWNPAKMVNTGLAKEKWKIEIPAASVTAGGKETQNAALPPKTDFFDKLTAMAVDRTGKYAVASYQTGRPGGTVTSRFVVCNLETGDTGTVATADGEWAALALHEDGERIVVRSNTFGFGNHDRLEIWTLEGEVPEKLVQAVPFNDLRGPGRDLIWAEFVDENRLAICGSAGHLAVLDFPSLNPHCHMETAGGGKPAISPDRKLMAFSQGENLCLLEIDSRKIVAKMALKSKLQSPLLAFSSSGKRLACVVTEGALCWDVATGQLLNEIPANGAHFQGGIAFPDDKYLFAGNEVMLDLENQLQLWSYSGAEFTTVVGETTIMAVTEGERPGLILTAKLPHPDAVEMLSKAQSDPNLFVFKEGTSVSLNLEAITDPAARDRATQAITNELTRLKCSVDPSSDLQIRATVTGPKSTQVTYTNLFGFGAGGQTYSVQEWTSTLEFVLAGRVVWTRNGGTNVPGTISPKDGQTVESILRASEKPNYRIFENPVLPKFIQRPQPGQGVNSRTTLGHSRVTTGGLR